MRNRILLMYITVRSGHFQAARALERGIRLINPRADILTIDAFQYLNPVLARIVDRMYLSVIQKLPELWDYLYDNPKVIERSDRLRRLLHQYDSPRLKALLEEFKPEVVACTQAFPCGLVADYKSENGLNIPLYGIITDFLPHAYWVHSQVDGYIVGSTESRQWLMDRRIDPARISASGIPIDPSFSQEPDRAALRRRLQLVNGFPTILLMGGGQGLGPIVDAVKAIDSVRLPLQLMVVAGTNEKMYHQLITLVPRLRHSIQLFGHVDFIPDLMSVATLLITKPGGLTTSEALAKGLPILVLNPIPGQEVKNAHFLEQAKVGWRVEGPENLPQLLERLLNEPHLLREMMDQARALGKPRAAEDAARFVLGLQAGEV